MHLKDIHVGRTYEAKVNGRITSVRVDSHKEVFYGDKPAHRFDVTNLSTGRRTTFRSAAKFRRAVA